MPGPGTLLLGCQYERESPGYLVTHPFLEDREELEGLT